MLVGSNGCGVMSFSPLFATPWLSVQASRLLHAISFTPCIELRSPLAPLALQSTALTSLHPTVEPL
jgi:hypothetical protein